MLKLHILYSEKLKIMQEALLYVLLAFTPLAYGSVEVWSVTVLHLISLTIAAVWAVSVINKRSSVISRTPLDMPNLFLFLVVCLSALTSVYSYASAIQTLKIINYIFVFYLVVNLTQDRGKLLRLVIFLVIFGSVFATAGILLTKGSLLGFKIFSSSKYGLSLTFVNYNHFAGYLEMMVLLCIGLALSFSGAKRVIFLVLGVYIGVAVFFSLSRGGVIGMFSGLIFLIILSAIIRNFRRNLKALSFYLVALIMVVSTLGASPVIERMQTLSNPLHIDRVRLDTWRSSLDMVSDNILLGSGAGTFRYAFPKFRADTTYRRVDHAHNDYLEIASELGVIGLFLLFFCFSVMFVSVLKNVSNNPDRRLQALSLGSLAACFSLMVHGLVDFNFYIPSNAILFVVSSAIALNSSRMPGHGAGQWKTYSFDIIRSRIIYSVTAVLFISILSTIMSPFVGQIYKEKAIGYKNDNNYELAAASMKRAIFFNPGNAELNAEMGNLLLSWSLSSDTNSDKEYYLVKSLKYYEDASSQCSVCALYHGRRGYVLKKLGRHNGAEAAFKKAVANSPKDVFLRYDLASYFRDLGRFDDAKEEYREILLLDSSYYLKVFNDLWEVAQDYYSMQSAIPKDDYLRKKLAYFLMQKGKEGEALKELEYAVALNPVAKNAVAHLKGICFINGCGVALEKASEYNRNFNNDPAYRKQLAVMNDSVGNVDEAILFMRALITDKPSDVSHYLYLAGLYKKTYRFKDEVDTLYAGIKLNPDDPRLHSAVVYLCELRSRYPKAAGILQEVADNGPNDSERHYKLAVCYQGNRESGKALEEFKKAISLKPGKVRYRFQLGWHYKHLGLYQEAIEQFTMCLEVDPEYDSCKRDREKIYKELRKGD